MACSPNDYLRILGLVESSTVMHFYFVDGTHLRGTVARAELDPITRSGLLLLVLPDYGMMVHRDAGELVKVSSRAPDGSQH